MNRRLLLLLGISFFGLVIPAFGQRPIISYIDKTTGSINEILTISGAGFSDDAEELAVYFGGAQAEIVFASPFLIEAKIPNNATWGPIQVVNLESGQSGISTQPFTLSFGGDDFDPTFINSAVNFRSFSAIYDLCTCDFNSDGKLDVASSHQVSINIDVLINQGTLENIDFERQPLEAGATTTNITCGDLNNDGKPDIVAGRNGEPELFVFLNETPEGSFDVSFAPRILLSTSGQTPRRPLIKDLNQDGQPEIILTNETNEIDIFQNLSSDGNFDIAETPSTLRTPIGPKAGLSIADFNQDGFPEIVVAGFVDDNIFIFNNISNPQSIRFAPVQVITVPGKFSNVMAIDLDEDDYIDLAVTEVGDGELLVLRNTGASEEDHEFESPLAINLSTFPWGISAADMNGDGQVDLSVATLDPNQRIHVLTNFSEEGTITLENDIIRANGLSRNLKQGDINGDGKPDLIVASLSTGNISILQNENCLVPDLAPSETITICEGLDFKISATESPGTIFRWALEGSTIQEDTLPSVQVDTEGEYTVTAISNGGLCANSSPGVVQLIKQGTIPAPPSITSPEPACIGEDVTLSATPIAGAQYVWTGPQGLQDTLDSPEITIEDFNAEVAGRYFVEVIFEGCQSGTVSAVTQVVNLPFIEIFNDRASPNLCDGDSILLQVTNYPGYDYQWYRNDQPLVTDRTRIFVRNEALFEAEIIDPLGCTFLTDPIGVQVFSPPIANFQLIDATCAGEEIRFRSSSTIDSDATTEYVWNFGNSEGGDGDSIDYVYPGRGDFIVSLFVNYEGVENCEDTRTRPLGVTSAPEIEFSNSTDTLGLCPGDSLTLTITNSFRTYRWSTGSDQVFTSISNPGTYSVIAENLLGCTDTISIQIDSLPLPTLTVTADPIAGIVRGDSALLTAEGGAFYLWEPDTSLSNDTTSSVWAFPQSSTEYILSAINEYGCFGSVNYFLEVFPTREDPLPAAFSPNGDGIDDTWTLVNNLAFSDCKLVILNRNGSTVYSTESGYENTWDGTYQNNPLPEGVYYYIFECPDTEPYTGSITIVR
ncbi:MAG TPA: hypothetical protein DCE41_29150 [Cytophagales bacterium]|nr:hypothetical protein [Cytophagales bacterium]HAA18006.1 hypothetical protein [Cytophagales bacterium]HAP63086.1 hypothetical protein [Cytophagales bacterium]